MVQEQKNKTKPKTVQVCVSNSKWCIEGTVRACWGTRTGEMENQNTEEGQANCDPENSVPTLLAFLSVCSTELGSHHTSPWPLLQVGNGQQDEGVRSQTCPAGDTGASSRSLPVCLLRMGGGNRGAQQQPGEKGAEGLVYHKEGFSFGLCHSLLPDPYLPPPYFDLIKGSFPAKSSSNLSSVKPAVN